MNMTELDHALRKLRLSGMADTVELRLLEAQSEKMAPIDQIAAAVEPACAMALEMEQPTYQFVRRYLERQPTLPLSLKQVDPLIRELTHYRDLIDRRLEGEVHESD